MPKLTTKGPDLPPALLEEHAEGRLVLFCGAGVSMLKAGLPGFQNLVADAFGAVGTLTDEAKRAIKRSEFDRALEILGEEVGSRLMRDAVARLLQTPPSADLSVHRFILDLAKGRDGSCRLVTTNFDNLFYEVDPGLTYDWAPKLPVPLPHKWNGVVHLHGSIRDPTPDGVNLVLTRADFGNAYLLERWASRFVGELFRNFSVLFVGYGVDDPVLRYLVDAIAAEGGRAATYREAYAFAGVMGRRREVERAKQDWRAKGVEPLFFHSGWEYRELFETLRRWRDLYVGRLHSRRYFVLKNADNPPPSADDETAKLVVWGLSEPSGSIARAFADRDPPPPLEWLRIFEESDHLPGGRKLLMFPVDHVTSGGAAPGAELGVPLLDDGSHEERSTKLSGVTLQLGRWLTRHVGDKRLLHWILRPGRRPHQWLLAAIESASTLR